MVLKQTICVVRLHDKTRRCHISRHVPCPPLGARNPSLPRQSWRHVATPRRSPTSWRPSSKPCQKWAAGCWQQLARWGALPGMQPVCTQLYTVHCTHVDCTHVHCTPVHCTTVHVYTVHLYTVQLYTVQLYNVCSWPWRPHPWGSPGGRAPGPPRKGASAGILLPSCKVQGAKVLSPWHLEGGVAGRLPPSWPGGRGPLALWRLT